VREKDATLRALMVEPDFTDSEISFGEMAMHAGRAFSLGDDADGEAIRVGKQLVEIQGSLVLVESAEFEQLAPLLAKLASVGQQSTDSLAIHSSRRIQRADQKATAQAAG
jgi:hypothetical protein